MKTNNKGYMLVELIVSAVIAFIVVYYLITMTVRMVNKNNDYHIETEIIASKNIITKEIMDDFEKENIKEVNVSLNKQELEFVFSDDTNKKLSIIKDSSNTKIVYDKINKKFSNDKCIIENFSIDKDTTNKIININIPIYTNFSDENLGINLLLNYDDTVLNKDNIPISYSHEELLDFELDSSEQYSVTRNLTNNINKIKSCKLVEGYTGNLKCEIINNKVKFTLSGSNIIKNTSNKIEVEPSISNAKQKKVCHNGEVRKGDCYIRGEKEYVPYNPPEEFPNDCPININNKCYDNQHMVFMCKSDKWVISDKNIISAECKMDDNGLVIENNFCYYENPELVPVIGSSCDSNGGGLFNIVHIVGFKPIKSSFVNKYVCNSDETISNKKCYKCSDGYTLDKSNYKCSKINEDTKFLYQVKIKYD